MDFKNPEVIKKHNRTAFLLRSLIILWTILSLLITILIQHHIRFLQNSIFGFLYYSMYLFVFLVPPFVVIGIYIICVKIYRKLSG